MSIVKNVVGAVITVAIGGTVYTVSQPAVVDNFVKDTGLSQQEAEKYVEDIKDDLVSWTVIGDDMISDGNELIKVASSIDCENYTYEWVSATVTCEEGKNKINEIGNDELSLGKAYKKLDQDSSSLAEIPQVIRLIDKLNADYKSNFVANSLDAEYITESMKTNSYNKATLQAVLEGN